MPRSISQKDLRWFVLDALREHEMAGLQVADSLAAQGLQPAAGLVYAALRRLEREGLLEATWVEMGPDSPRRRYYALTPAGEASLARSRTRPYPAPAKGSVRP